MYKKIIATFTELTKVSWRAYASVSWVIIDWNNDVLPVYRQGITWTSTDLLLNVR